MAKSQKTKTTSIELDRNFKCSKSLKTMFALKNISPEVKKMMLEAQHFSNRTEYAVQAHVVPEAKVHNEKKERFKKKFKVERED